VKRLVVNADGFGASDGVNHGIAECHVRGIVTSTSLLVDAPAADEAAELARAHPRLSVGLHWYGDRLDLGDEGAVRREWRRQLARFEELMDGRPTHVDSHHHVHRAQEVEELFGTLVAPLAVPLRGDGTVHVIGGFYAQWEDGVTDLERVSVGFLEHLLREEVADGWTELSCHPGRVTPGFRSSYLQEREAELRTLTDPRLPQLLREVDVELASYRDLARR
jgi:chitin disaccharide deacetylase